MAKKVLVWMRRDLRRRDNPALHAAAKQGKVLPLYIEDPDMGAAQKVWVAHTIEQLREEGLPIVYRTGDPRKVIPELVEEKGIDAVYWNRTYHGDPEPHLECEVETFNGSLLIEPWEVKNQKGEFYRVFTPYWRAARELMEVEELLPAPRCEWVKAKSEPLTKDPKWSKGIEQAWSFGEKAAHRRLKAWVEGGLDRYAQERDRMDHDGTSRLSPYLATGQLSPRQVWHAVVGSGASKKSVESYLSELGWREFSYHLLYHFPNLKKEPFRPEFSKFPWRLRGKELEAWQKGETGYPVVDAAMRQLWEKGWMHNRARMIVASFLTKDLLFHWRVGEEWFWDTLVDADPASNCAGWQWTAGCGADAAPFFRVFNPTSQGEKFDPTGKYVEKYVAELGSNDYPEPIVDHADARRKALDLYEKVKK